MKVNLQISIDAPVEPVFTLFTNLETATKNIDGIQKIEVLKGSAQMQVGTKWRETREFFGKEALETMWVTELVPSTRYVVEADSRGTKYESIYEFSKTEDGTLVSMSFNGKPHSLSAKLMSGLAWMTKGAIKNALRKDLENLKAVAERQELDY